MSWQNWPHPLHLTTTSLPSLTSYFSGIKMSTGGLSFSYQHRALYTDTFLLNLLKIQKLLTPCYISVEHMGVRKGTLGSILTSPVLSFPDFLTDFHPSLFKNKCGSTLHPSCFHNNHKGKHSQCFESHRTRKAYLSAVVCWKCLFSLCPSKGPYWAIEIHSVWLCMVTHGYGCLGEWRRHWGRGWMFCVEGKAVNYVSWWKVKEVLENLNISIGRKNTKIKSLYLSDLQNTCVSHTDYTDYSVICQFPLVIPIILLSNYLDNTILLSSPSCYFDNVCYKL